MQVLSKNVLLMAATAGLGGLVPMVASASISQNGRDSSLTRRETVFKNGTAFSKSFKDAKLFDGQVSYSEDNAKQSVDATVDISVTCAECYVTGQVTTELTIIPPSGSNGTTANLTSLAHVFVDDVANITETVLDDITGLLKNDTKALLASPDPDTIKAFFHNLTRPTIDVDFSLVETAATLVEDNLPEYGFSLTLDGFEVYVQTQLEVTGSVTYKVNLYTSETDYGIKEGDNLELGVVLTVDLLMNANLGAEGSNGVADGGIEVDSGFHLRMNDGLALIVDLFGNNVSDIVFNGGQFEFLPVTVSTSALTLNAVLRVGVHAGIVLSSDALTFDGIDLATYSAGAETVVFADVANLTLSVAVAGTNDSAVVGQGEGSFFGGSDVLGCAAGSSADLVVEEIFGFDIGADAGASVQIGDLFSWGIGPTTMLPVFYTTVAQCAGSVSSAIPSTATATATATGKTTATATATGKSTATATEKARRAASSTTTVLTTSVVYSAVACRSPGLINCPASLQSTAVTTATSKTTLTVPSGSEATWPDSTTSASTTLTKLAAFGGNAKSIDLTASGTPSSYVPPPTSTSTTASSGTGSPTGAAATGITIAGHHLTPKQEHIAIGVAVGVGVPLLVGAAAGIIFLIKRSRSHVYKLTPQHSMNESS
ncbi:hypothetical protein SBRCBS47491_008033 [Sporothrix bragantina]|uniref:Mid2 domain-containing protein n=1 Tax=Sporothrix bragantina TaxID=671064 RepID=A0ABP0CJF0_9PEZI